MSIMRNLACIAALIGTSLLASPASGQREIHHMPPWISPSGENPDLMHPFVEPLTFQHDLQFFAPSDSDLFGNTVREPTGWLATYDRVYMYVSRPDGQVASNPPGTVSFTGADHRSGDFTWGNRFDIGYMTAEDHGWTVSFWHIDGPNLFNGLAVERIDVFEPQDEINNDPANVVDLRGGGTGGGGGGQQQQNQMRLGQPRRDANDPVTGARDYRLRDSINVADLTSVELNKTFRIDPLHYGSIIEPFLGVRYMKFIDTHRRDTYDRFNNITGAPLGTSLPVPTANINQFSVEDFTTAESEFINHMVGGQIGMRWYKRKERWLLSAEARAFALQNFQSWERQTDRERTYFAAVAADQQILTVTFDQSRNAANAAEFVFGTEIRAEAAYEVTRDISLRAGMSFMEFARGVGRGDNPGDNDQDVTMVGATFGFTVNR